MAIQVKLARGLLRMVLTIERVSILEHPVDVQIVWGKDMYTIYVSTAKHACRKNENKYKIGSFGAQK